MTSHEAAAPGVRPTIVSRWARFGPLLSLLAVTTVVYWFFATGGSWRFDVSRAPYYHLLGEALLAGQLHLEVAPSAELLALADPYDPDQNSRYRLHDASLYQGRYYLYWGPVPGLLHAGWRLVTGVPLYDSVVQVGAGLVASVGFWLILQRARQRYLPASPGWLLWGSSLSFALGGVMLYLVGRPSVYHEALLVAMGLLLLSWYSLFVALEGARARRRYLACSGTMLALAIGSRITYLGYAVGPGLVLGWALLSPGVRGRRAALLDLASFGAPLAVAGLLLALYNVLRFGSAAEFGMTYVLQGSSEFYRAMRAPTGGMAAFLTPDALPGNILAYLFFRPPADLSYPLATYAVGWLADPTGHGGTLVETPMMPLFLLAPAALLAPLAPLSFAAPRRCGLGPVRALVASVLLGLFPTLALLGSARGVTLRYTADVLPGLTLLGSLLVLGWSAGAVGTGRPWSARPGVHGAGMLRLGFAIASWGVSVVLGGLLGLGAWQHSFPVEALRVRAFVDGWLGQLGLLLGPGLLGI